MSQAINKTLSLDQGATWMLSFEYLDDDGQPIDLTGCTARMQLRATPATPVLLELSTQNTRLLLAGATGIIELLVDAPATAALSCESGVYDLRVTFPGGRVDVVMAGRFCLALAVTK
ncbi:hypothetical protein RCH06_001869 [Polaromonas sp. CG_9.5]|uniref:hypothetical protein n=1 Tax=Polaromonas sp. CG_9.5 TaxID=3071705 RepID=UPI002E08DCD5|nr:hypothetical protein [Polaromonas sp. CG_9.5]